MKLFNRKEQQKRSLEELFTPKEESDILVENEGEKELEEEQSEENTFIEQQKVEKCKSNDSVNAFDCFGWDEEKTDKWLKKCANVWYLIISFFWFLFGAFTFAPVVFISNKVNVLFNNKKKSFVCGLIIYAILFALVIFLFTARGNTDVIST